MQVKNHFLLGLLIALVTKHIFSYNFIPFIFAMTYAGYKTPHYFLEEDYDLRKVAKAHGLVVNSISWLSYFVVFYSTELSGFGYMYGLLLPIVGFALGVWLFPLSISYMNIYLTLHVFKRKGEI